jgi:peptide/nickel transport system permease protein
MLQFILRRLLMLIPVITGLTIIMFAIARILPGDPVGLAAGPNATQAEIAALSAEFGLDQPIWVQY